jgi:NAD+ kinase
MQPQEFKTIGITGKPNEPAITGTLNRLGRFLSKKGYRLFLADNCQQYVSDFEYHCCPLEELGKQCDVVIVVGGDGTFLAAARAVVEDQIPLIGVNLGRLGFLVDISPDELATRLDHILQGHYKKEYRSILRAKIIRNHEVIHQQTAVNEVVIHRWVTPSMIEIITSINGAYFNTQRSDGLIVATPTGSTAYSLSAGGPIIQPSLNALVLVPLNPHTLSNRPVVIDDNCEIEIRFSQAKQIHALVTCDHLEIPDVLISDTITIKKESRQLIILHPEDHDFFKVLRDKLNWSSGYHI